MAVSFFVPGDPAPQGSKRHVGNGIMLESSKFVGPWRLTIGWHAREAMRGGQPFEGAVAVVLAFVMRRPKRAAEDALAIKRPDVDKLARAALDALSAICFSDDAQVVDLHAHKRLAKPGEQAGVAITVREAS